MTLTHFVRYLQYRFSECIFEQTETQPSYSTSHLAPNYVQLCATFLNTAKYFKTLRCGCGAVAFIFSIYLEPGLYLPKENDIASRIYLFRPPGILRCDRPEQNKLLKNYQFEIQSNLDSSNSDSSNT